jgi:hypothetical protein
LMKKGQELQDGWSKRKALKLKKKNWSKGRTARHIFGKFKLQKCSACQDLQKISHS